MNMKALVGATLAVMLVGLGALAGSVIGNTSAQTKTTDPTTPSTTPSTGNPTAPSTDPSPNLATGIPGGRGFGGHGMRGGMGMVMGMDGFGFGGRGGIGKGMAATADGANNTITRATEMITLVKDDLAYATGKMDTANIQRWLDNADTLVKSAQSAVQSSKYESAVNYAGAAMELAFTAETEMGRTLGYDKLPSYSQRPLRPNKGMPDANATITQAQASRVLAHTYEHLVMQKAVIGNTSEANSYLTEAQNAYKTAYDAYTAGKYSEAVTSAHLASKLAGVAHRVYNAVNAPNSTDAPVTVPQPNF
jgi:hypothetical protein